MSTRSVYGGRQDLKLRPSWPSCQHMRFSFLLWHVLIDSSGSWCRPQSSVGRSPCSFPFNTWSSTPVKRMKSYGSTSWKETISWRFIRTLLRETDEPRVKRWTHSSGSTISVLNGGSPIHSWFGSDPPFFKNRNRSCVLKGILFLNEKISPTIH
jgi:hypothetical protein